MATLPPVRCTDALRDALEARAVEERRKVSEVVRFAVESYLAGPSFVVVPRGTDVVLPDDFSAQGALADGSGVNAGSDAATFDPAAPLPRRRLARREMCEHRVPPTSFCKECDA